MGFQSAVNTAVGTVAAVKTLNSKIKDGFIAKEQGYKAQIAEGAIKQAQTNLALQQKRQQLGELKTNRNVNKAQRALEMAQRANESLMGNGRAAFEARQRGGGR